MEIKFLDSLAKSFEKLPGVGKKTAQRYAYCILNGDEQNAQTFAENILNAKKNIKFCNFFLKNIWF